MVAWSSSQCTHTRRPEKRGTFIFSSAAVFPAVFELIYNSNNDQKVAQSHDRQTTMGRGAHSTRTVRHAFVVVTYSAALCYYSRAHCYYTVPVRTDGRVFARATPPKCRTTSRTSRTAAVAAESRRHFGFNVYYINFFFFFNTFRYGSDSARKTLSRPAGTRIRQLASPIAKISVNARNTRPRTGRTSSCCAYVRPRPPKAVVINVLAPRVRTSRCSRKWREKIRKSSLPTVSYGATSGVRNTPART